MRVILTPNLEPPFNLRRFSVSMRVKENLGLTEDEIFNLAIQINQKAGQIPFLTVTERDTYIAELLAQGKPVPHLPPPGPHWIVDETQLPGGVVSNENDYFFNCWEWSNGAVVNMPKARILQMNKIRLVRDKELAKLDVPFMRAVEAGDTSAQSTVATKKQVLRDIPTSFSLDGYADAAALKAAWPSELPARE